VGAQQKPADAAVCPLTDNCAYTRRLRARCMAALRPAGSSWVVTTTSCTMRPARATSAYPPSTFFLLMYISRSCEIDDFHCGHVWSPIM